MHYLYILHSKELNRYYVGETMDLEKRLIQHNSGFFKKSYTSNSTDWKHVLSIPFQTIGQARGAERFVKKMKSSKFIERLIQNPDWLKERFNK